MDRNEIESKLAALEAERKALEDALAEAEKEAETVAEAAVCPVCGKPVEADAIFCTSCGAPLNKAEEPEAPEEAPAGARCPVCGAPIDNDALFCTTCGAKIEKEEAPAAEEPAAEEPASPVVDIPDLDALPEWSVESESELKEHEGTPYSFVVYKNAAPMALPEAAHKSTDMSEYFRKREPIAVDLFDDEAYKSELLALLNAYYHPLADGFGAEDVDRFFSEGSDRSFEQYLRDRRLIAAPEDFEALANTFSPDKAEAKHRICVTKEALDDFASSLTLSAALLADRFKA